MMQQLLKGKRVLLSFAALALLLAGCSLEEATPLNPKGVEGQEQLNLMILSIVIMVIVVVVVFAIAIYVLVRFRKRPGDDSIPKQVEGNHKLEIIWTVIPLILLTILAVPTVGYTFKHDQQNIWEQEDVIRVQVVAHQFWWEFNYPDLGIATSQDLVMPVGKKVAFELTSADVNHSFWIPGIGGKKDTNPGQKVYMHLQPTEVGTYKGKCAELCGQSHAYMDFKAIVKSEEDFNAWVADMTEENAVSSDAAAGEQVFQKANCISCHAIAPGGKSPAAPNLNGFGERTTIGGILPHNEEELKEWIRDPQSKKPGTLMPKFPDLSEEEMDQLAKYLLELK
ncbi:cytochrome c oxidase subunit II [Paenibacillus alkalitolerans]|uniref:cytochrome c oxidase subunit II n=1 Tax=Paenibacillus alkalitolerans TaxID=2799335 RepID=UPI002D7FD1DB|nr:cytochrome c oxidase subunit II [Paenibacillus alkalitolerans]